MYICEINKPSSGCCGAGAARRARSTAASSARTALASYLYRLLHQVHLGLMPGKHFLEDRSTVKELGFAGGQTAILSVERPAAYQVRVPQEVLEAFGVEGIHRVLWDRQTDRPLWSSKARTQNPGHATCEENTPQSIFPG